MACRILGPLISSAPLGRLGPVARCGALSKLNLLFVTAKPILVSGGRTWARTELMQSRPYIGRGLALATGPVPECFWQS